MISKKLLSEVLKHNILDIEVEENLIWYKSPTIINGNSTNKELNINIYELAHKCKEWAYTNGYILVTWNENPHFYDSEWQCQIFKLGNITATKRLTEHFLYWLNSEPEAIFKACEWILANDSNI